MVVALNYVNMEMEPLQVTMCQKIHLNGDQSSRKTPYFMQIVICNYGILRPLCHGGIIIWISIQLTKMISMTLSYVGPINTQTKTETLLNSVSKNVKRLWKKWVQILSMKTRYPKSLIMFIKVAIMQVV